VAQSFGWASMVAGRSGVDLARKELGRGLRKVEEVEGGVVHLLAEGVMVRAGLIWLGRSLVGA